MVRVRPGIELTRAMALPTSEFSRLDLPTLERPRKATSGACMGGNCTGSAAEMTNSTRRLKGAREVDEWYDERREDLLMGCRGIAGRRLRLWLHCRNAGLLNF